MLLAAAATACFLSTAFVGARVPAQALRGATLREAGGSGEFDFGEYDAPVGVSISEAAEEDAPDLAPPEAEIFLQRETGVWECKNCGYEYNRVWGEGNISPGTDWKDVPDNFRCPKCRVSKDQFEARMEEVAGFADNQDYGLGFNTMTGGQKGIFIWGTLGLLFMGLLGGYLLD